MSNPATNPGQLASSSDVQLFSPPGHPQAPQSAQPRRFFGLQRRVALSLAALLVVLTVIGILVSVVALRQALNSEFQTKGEAIANSLASVAPNYLATQDVSQLQSLIDDYARVPGVAYVLVTDAKAQPLAHTFVPFVPETLLGAAPETSGAQTTLRYKDPDTGASRQVLNITVPVLAGYLGTVRIGMDLDLIAAQQTRTALLLAGALLIVGTLALLGSTVFTRRLIQPIEKLAALSARVAQGDLSQRANLRSNDEIGVLAVAFDSAIDRLEDNEVRNQRERQEAQILQDHVGEFLDVTMNIADGDLTQRGRVTEDVLGNVVDSINLMVEELEGVLRQVQTASASVNEGAQSMLQSTDQIAEGAQTTATEAERVREQVGSVTISIRQMAQSAQASAQTAQAALHASQQGQEAVNSTLAGMQNIRREVAGISKRIKGLGDRSLEIQEIVDTISRLSSQTNLLALNAAIEAAGAGEAGIRFAVVADEVRKLAESSATSTARIAGLIKSVQAEIQQVVVSVEDGTREVEAGYRVAGTAGERLTEIAQLAERSAQLANDISGGTEAQVRRVEQVGESVTSIAQVAGASRVSVQSGRDTAERLGELADDLNAKLARFRLSS